MWRLVAEELFFYGQYNQYRRLKNSSTSATEERHVCEFHFVVGVVERWINDARHPSLA